VQEHSKKVVFVFLDFIIKVFYLKFCSGDLAALGACINCHRKNKLIMAPGSEPKNVVSLMEKIEPLVYGMALAGAGGGGFLFVLMKEPSVREKIEEIIAENALGMQIYEAKVSNKGYQCKFY